ncbi:MAG: hypothetical protein P4L98_00385 [Ancalomicrobiaceae bacterium]|nr:hypothetical protein [Ancalomicrobiaceae bacterium]
MTRFQFFALPLIAAMAGPAAADIALKPIACPFAAVGYAITGAKGESDGVAAEYRWLGTNRPGWRRDNQALQHKDGRDFDILDISLGEQREEICFDITAFFGRF